MRCLAMRCLAIRPRAAFLSFLVALYFFMAACAPNRSAVGAAPDTQGKAITCAAVRRLTGSMVRRPCTSCLASWETLSHHDDGELSEFPSAHAHDKSEQVGLLVFPHLFEVLV